MNAPRDNPLVGAGYFLRGFALIARPGVRRYVVVPLVVNVALFTGLIWFGAAELRSLVAHMLPQWLDWLKWVLVPLFLVASLAVAFFCFNLVANLVAAPFNGLLAEAIERELTGRTLESGGWGKLVREIGVTFANEARKLVYVAIRTLPLLLLFLVPVLNVAASIAWLLLTAWMLTISYADFPMSNHGIAFPDQRRILREHRLLGLGFGLCTLFALSIPILNFVVIPCAVAGATAMWVERLESTSRAGPTA